MSYLWRLWLGFAVVLSVLLAAMGWMSATAIRLERAEALATQRAATEANVRLALWRMDSALAPLLARESVHPYYTNAGPSIAAVPDLRSGPPPVGGPDRAVSDDSWYALLRFQTSTDFDLSPMDLTPPAVATEEPTRGPIRRLAQRIPYDSLRARLSRVAVSLPEPQQGIATPSLPLLASTPTKAGVSFQEANEFQQRSQSLVMNNAMVQQLQNQQSAVSEPSGIPLTPVWISGEMLLARRVRGPGNDYLQGCLLDWPAMQEWLLEMVADLLPEGQLEPLEAFDPGGEAGLLAALPVRLLPGSVSDGTLQPPSAMPQMLALVWLAVLLSAIVGAVLVHGIVRLSQRRAAFVAAVTHELRTPLTTFRMYTEMLVQGMVPDAAAQREYLETLRDESLRLTHLVQNVLAYARLERGRELRAPQEVFLSHLLDPLLPRLQQQAAAAQMEWVVEGSPAFEIQVRVNPSSVEQILINLVDNACKYAHAARNRRITLSARREGRFLALRVRDYGPGLPAKRKWFRPFDKTVQEAAHSAPGVGLGLGLSRRLAEQMGGRLEIDRQVTEGASIVLRLRLATDAPGGR